MLPPPEAKGKAPGWPEPRHFRPNHSHFSLHLQGGAWGLEEERGSVYSQVLQQSLRNSWRSKILLAL